MKLSSHFISMFLLRRAGVSAIVLCGLVFNGCSNSDDPVVQPVIPPVTPSTVEAGIYGSTVVEGADDLEFVVSLSAPHTATISLDYATINGTAIAGTDYSATSGTVQFAPGEVRKFIPVAVLNNASTPAGTSNSMQLVLSNPQNATLSNDTATGTIIDSDAMSTDTEFNADWGPTGAFTNAAKCGADCHKSDGISICIRM